MTLAQQFAKEKINKGGMLEVISDGNNYDENIHPIPIEQLAAALEGLVAANKSKYCHKQGENKDGSSPVSLLCCSRSQ